ncbi:PGPGW domain-containing protein [Mongoliimonas terrestris]|uniref:PGPGW domain-containing protein n=1 Tax=Mongoliimonas terrestris TaxID=1709001 RepID=UPI000AC65837
MPRVKLNGRSFPVPRYRPLRIAIGILFLIGGFVGFLPILGFWMVPVGLLILSIDFAIARRVRRRSEVWIVRWWRNRKASRRMGHLHSRGEPESGPPRP